MKACLTFFSVLFICVSCTRDFKIDESTTSPNYYDSLYNVSFLKQIKPIKKSDSYRETVSNSILENNFILTEGIQNINLFSELEKSHQLQKPLLLYFTSLACVNCRKIEHKILNREEIKSYIHREFIFIPLCVDDKTSLPESHWIDNPHKKYKQKKHIRPLSTIGSVNSYFQTVISRTSGQPNFIILDRNRQLNLIGYTTSSDEFLDQLNQAIKKFNE